MKFEQTKHVVTYALKHISGKTLDLGAGRAKYKPLIQKAASEYIAFDLFPGDHIDVVGDITATGFPDNTFDTVISTQVFEHIPAPWLAAKEIQRILKPGGTAIVTAPFLQPYHADPHDYYRYTTEGMKALFEQNGFETIECAAYTHFFMVLSELFRHTSYFSEYKKVEREALHRNGKHDWYRGRLHVMTNRIMEYITRIARFLDRYVEKKQIYGNVYIIARKI